jgi:hypothetical protein
MAVAIKMGDKFELGETVSLFKVGAIVENAYDVNAAGDRFLMVATEPSARSTPFTVVLNWMSEIKR